ncbi:MAG: hypothetical protein IJD23_11285 [Spirochaetaceae bacterium]|nr:hypothetical protein [Spirochaetaceae bacterium]
MKKLLSIFVLQIFIFGCIFGATINSKKGYVGLSWKSTVADAKAEYNLTFMSTPSDKEFLEELYTETVAAYKVDSNKRDVSSLQFHFYKGNLFAVIEKLSLREFSIAALERRYGSFAQQGINKIGQQYMDLKQNPDGTVESLSIMISVSNNTVTTIMCDWNVYKEISVVGKALSSSSKSNSGTSTKLQKNLTIVDDLMPLANKLVQENLDGSKPSFAFVALTTDYKNTLVDNYITDALSEAMFNTGKIKIIERGNLEAILSEQKFQASGLVNEQTAKDIGMIAGVDFVCYGTLKDIGDIFTVNARVVDVETGEVAAMSRANITKDAYLKKQVQSAVGSSVYTTVTTNTVNTTSQEKTESVQTPPKVENNVWKVTKYYDEFGGFTHYVFTVNSADSRMLVVSYQKYENIANSRVIAGVHWVNNYKNYSENDNRDNYDIKGQDGTSITKYFSDNWKMYTDSSEKEYFWFGWDEKSGSRWLVDIIRKSDSVAVRRDGLTRRFQTAGLMDKMAEYGITWAEIDAALANEEF